MKDVFVVADTIFSPLGGTTGTNFALLRKGISGVRRHDRPDMADVPFYAALFDRDSIPDTGHYTKFEQILISSIGAVLKDSDADPADPGTILILSTTKGNISLLESGIEDPGRFSLAVSGRRVGGHFDFKNPPIVISNACISG